jgi:superfamily II RNA helicase
MEIQNETQNEKIKDLERELECHKKDVEKQNEKIKDLERKLECHKKDAEKQKKEYQKTIRNVKHKLEDLSIKSIKFEYELRLIQARDAIKNIIDLFSKALGVEQDISYNDKIFAVKEIIFKKRIKGFNIDKDLVIFLDKIYRYLNFSNRNAHSLNLDQPILDQIFDYIEPNNNLKELKKKMEEGNMNNLLKDLAKI